MTLFQLQNKKPSNLMPNAHTVELWLKNGNHVTRIEVLVCKGIIVGDLLQDARESGYCLTSSQLVKLESAIAKF